MIIHGIGEALEMAERRNSDLELIKQLIEKKAVAEAFGYYFNQDGEIVHKVSTVGIQLEDLTPTKKLLLSLEVKRKRRLSIVI